MRLGEKQELFSALLPALINKALDLGFRVRVKEVWRSHEQAVLMKAQGKGIINSLHCKGLAIDLVLFKKKQPQWDSETYRELGEYWESLHEFACWGGNFRRRDGMHFSITHGGVK
jgi:hypothetical protein